MDDFVFGVVGVRRIKDDPQFFWVQEHGVGMMFPLFLKKHTWCRIL